MPGTTVKQLEERLVIELDSRDKKISHLEQVLETLEASKAAEIKSLEFRVKELELEKIRNDIIRDLHGRLIDDQNQYSRKTNLLIDGIKIGERDNDAKIRKYVGDVVKSWT